MMLQRGMGGFMDSIVPDGIKSAYNIENAVMDAIEAGKLPWYCEFAYPFTQSCVPVEVLPTPPIQRTPPAAPLTANQMTNPGAWRPDEVSAYTDANVRMKQYEVDHSTNTTTDIQQQPFQLTPLALGLIAAGVAGLLIFTRR